FQIIDYFTREVLYIGINGVTDPEYAGLNTFISTLLAGDSMVVGVPRMDNYTQLARENYYNQMLDLTGRYNEAYANEISNYLALTEVDYSHGLIHNGGEEVVTGVAVLYAYLLDSGLSQEAIRSRMDYLNEDYTSRLSLLGNNSRNPAYSNGLARQINTSLDTTIETENRQRVFANYMAVCDTVAQFYVNDVAYYCTENDGIPDYYQYVDVGIINGSYVRADCSGMVSAILVQAELLEISALNSSSYSYEYGQRDTWPDSVVYEMEAAGFVWHDYYEGIELQQGDIMVKPDIGGPNGHIEIFNNLVFENEIYTFSFYSWGKVYPAEPYTSVDNVYNGRYNNYLGFWRYEG
ncbi:MAG TPA: hypothetical protein PLA71_05830, partial [Saccharofermentans sp.]|nr:hypothetical protein [Saccharofermentans sp.]